MAPTYVRCQVTALVRSVAGQPDALLRAALCDQGWREGDPVTAISDGDRALPALVRSAAGGPVESIVDWFHLSMRVHHVEQVMEGLCALEPPPLVPLDQAQIDVERLRHLLWNGHHEKACEALRVARPWTGRYVPSMPFKHRAARRLPRARYRVTNWAGYEAGLRRRGDITVWIEEAALAGWQAPRRSTPGRQPRYSPLAILTALTLRAVFRLTYRQAGGLLGSVFSLLGLSLHVPDQTTLSPRAATLDVPWPGNAGAGAGSEPMYLLVDSTGLKLCGKGEWLLEKHGTAARRPWRALPCRWRSGSA